ncbi:MAG: cytochrome c-type biogenesis protein CcmH [Gammaproteobacteria bacterium]|nr:cytochrome c-type biogenesis protein CcmH [Gammaproteobacteria bacterium]MBL6819548.1 cytochrome c-type biogenesis protein CcmH [Gammaproteobacteria bacterium]MBL6899087.1 cytochrome c-type biogenesis protein CcmH [Gammaproteobacteria bacterium]
MKNVILLLFLISPLNAYSSDTDNQYKELIEELRCMVCQNQNLAESEAPLAVDMKQKIREMLEAGKDKNEIKQFLSERYSSYILYEPPINKQNFILWFAPFIFIIVLSFVLLRRYIK